MAAILKEYFPDIKVNYQQRDKLMPERGSLAVAKAKKLIGYNPTNPLETGFRKYIEWYKNSGFLKPAEGWIKKYMTDSNSIQLPDEIKPDSWLSQFFRAMFLK